jgi:hypothetical protein
MSAKWQATGGSSSQQQQTMRVVGLLHGGGFGCQAFMGQVGSQAEGCRFCVGVIWRTSSSQQQHSPEGVCSEQQHVLAAAAAGPW